jgi:high affinity Mn2+ porin
MRPPAALRSVFVRFVSVLFLGVFLSLSTSAQADTSLFPQITLPEGDSPWRVHGDFDLIGQYHNSFNSLYENTPPQGGNSFSSTAEGSQTQVIGLNLGYRADTTNEFWARAEGIRGVPLSQAGGLAGLTNNDLQRVINQDWQVYLAQAYWRHRVDLGGESGSVDEAPLQFGQSARGRRLTWTFGKQDLLGIYDYNTYAHKGQSGFLNWSLMTSSAFDFAADARGYTIGVTGDLAWDDYSVRFGRYMMPVLPNQLDLDYEGWWKDRVAYNLEFEKRWATGAARLTMFMNRMRVATFNSSANIPSIDDGFGQGSANPRVDRTKTGIGLNVEQAIDSHFGVFARAMTTQGDTETMAFTEADASVSAGIVGQGAAWGRPVDAVGLAFSNQYASAARQAYLQRGLYALFVGDGPNPYGAVAYGAEQVIEAYYLIGWTRNTHLTLDWQRIVNPAYNPNRGPIDVWGLRIHTEF